MLITMPSGEEPASPAARLLQQPDFDLCILAIMGFGTMIDVNVFKRCMEETLIKHPRFSSLLVMNDKKHGSSYWKRTKVDIEKHAFIPDLDPKIENPDEFVEDYTSGLSATPLDMRKPLWEVHILNVKTSDANSTAIFKMHHSLGDGVSLISLLMACSKKISDPESLPVISTKKQRPVTDNGLMKRLFVLVWTAFLIIFYTLIDCISFVTTVLFKKDGKNPIRLPQGGEISTKRFVHRIFNLDDIKLIKNAMNVTVNDVVLGGTEAGLSRYLNMRYATNEKSREKGPEITKKTNNLPRNLRLRSTVVFNLRTSATIEDLSDVMEKGKELMGMWGNKAAFALLPLSIKLQDDSLTHIRRAKATMDRKKLSLEPIFGFMLMKIVTKLLGFKITAALTSRIFHHSTLTFSNVVGPPEEVAFLGHPLRFLAPSVYGFPQPLVVHYQSYAGKLIISVCADGNTIPDPHQLCDDLVKSFENIKEAVIKRGLVKDPAEAGQ